MHLTEVRCKHTAREFMQVPNLIYKNDPYWIRPLDKDVEAVFDPGRNPHFRVGELTRWILKDSQGQLIGRVAAFVNRQLAETFKQPTGGFGFFECNNDTAAALMLFDQCKHWLQERGMEAMDGPINFGEKERFWGLLVDGFGKYPTYLMNYHPPYYKRLFEAYGFQNFYEQYIYYIHAGVVLPPVLEERLKRLTDSQGFHFDNLRLRQLEKYADDFMTIYNNAWKGTHKFFKPMTREEALKTFYSMKDIVDEDLVVFGYHENKPIAFLVCIPELNQLLRYVDGKLNLWGKIKFLYYRWRGKARTMQGLVFGIVPEFRNRGIESGLILKLRDNVIPKKRYKDLYMNWIGDFNPKMSRILEFIGAKKAFTLVTYRKLFDETVEFERHPVLD